MADCVITVMFMHMFMEENMKPKQNPHIHGGEHSNSTQQ